MNEGVNADELRINLQEYQDQLQQVETLLLDDPDNAEYRDIYQGLAEVIQITTELLAEACRQAPPSTVPAPRTQDAALPAGGTTTTAPEVRAPSVLPPQVAEQIRFAQQRAALAGQGPPAWAIGAEVQAVFTGDGQWYDGTVTAVATSGNFIVDFEGYGTQEEVDRQSMRQRPVSTDAGTGYKGVEAPKQRRVSDDTDVQEMPAWLEIKPTDDDKTRARKKKLQKNFKSKQRFQRMDAIQKHKADSWKTFVSGKGAKKVKRDSMFKVPEGTEGKVGVTGSGQGMTEYETRKRHEFQGEGSLERA